MNPPCPSCGAGCTVKHGHFDRTDDAQSVQRYRCKTCGKCFSSATFTSTYRQKRRRLNRLIEIDLASSTAQRRIAINHGCTRGTVARKLRFLAAEARRRQRALLRSRKPAKHVQWDELITFEHSRLKPLSVAVMMCRETRQILCFGVAAIPASGLMAKRSREKYGPRPDRSGRMRHQVLGAIAPHIAPGALIESDEHARYQAEIEEHLPTCTHLQYPSQRGSLTGQGELKRTGYDPLFGINHTLAMMRDNIKRLTRRTWCTTKLAECLEDQIAVYVHFHNTTLVARQ